MTIDLSNVLTIVTGYTGFLGSCLTDVLLNNGAYVVGLQLRPGKNKKESNRFNRHPRFLRQSIDERPAEIFKGNCLGRKKIACFHFAGNASAADCQANPDLAYESNVLLTLQVLEYCRLVGVKKIIYPSTGYVYGNHMKEAATEMTKRISTNIYTATKIATEALIESYAYFHGFDCRIGRVSNVYGQQSSNETVTGNIIGNVLKRRPIVLNNLKPVRDFIFIDDVIRGFLAFLENKNDQSCSYYNISTGIATSIQALAETACEVVNFSKENIVSRGLEQFSETKLVLNSSKLKAEFNWEPRFSIKDGLAKILSEKLQV